MIRVSSVEEAKDFDGEVIAIMRKLKEPGNMQQLDVLSPDWPLFERYLAARDAGAWYVEAFQAWYVTPFLEQMAGNPAAREAIRRLVREADSTSRCLVCACPDEQMCHRSIIAGILQEYGVKVEGVSQDYSAYGRAYRALLAGNTNGRG